MRGQLDRRTLIGASGAVLVTRRAGAQAPSQASIGVLSPFSAAAAVEWHRALEQGLRELGWVGANLRIEYRHAGGDTTVLPQLVDELMRAKVDVLVTEVTEATQAARRATTTLPIVMVAVGDPVAIGLVQSLARPGGNVTGLSQNIVESAPKRLELLKAAVSGGTDIAVLWNPDDENSALNWRALQTHAGPLGVQLKSLPAQSAADIEAALAKPRLGETRALYVVPGPLFVTNLKRIAMLTRERRVASIFHLPEYVHLGGLLAYGPDRGDLFRRAAAYVDRVLKGTKPADLPVEQANKYDLSINLATAKEIGVTFPQLMLMQATEIIE